MSRKEKLEQSLRKIVEKEKDRSVKLVLLDSSQRRSGSWNDNLIVVKETDKKFLDRLDEIYKDADVAMDVLVYTPEEFEKMKKFYQKSNRGG